MAWLEDTVFGNQNVAQHTENDELRSRLHQSEQTILGLQQRIEELEQSINLRDQLIAAHEERAAIAEKILAIYREDEDEPTQ